MLSPVVVTTETLTVVKGSWSLRFLISTRKSQCVKKSEPKMVYETAPTEDPLEETAKVEIQSQRLLLVNGYLGTVCCVEVRDW